MKRIHVITAIMMSITSFKEKTFSIYNITSDIRDNLNSGEWELEDFDDQVSHDTVKFYTQQLMDNLLSGLYTITHNTAGYREYTLKPVNSSLPDVAAITVNSIIPKDVQKKMYVYLKNNGAVTMKQIQSRLKGHSYTCQQIMDFLAQLQILDHSTLNLPASQVKTCVI